MVEETEIWRKVALIFSTQNQGKKLWVKMRPLTLSYFCTYIYVRSPKPRCDSCTYIYVHGLCDRNMGLLPASKRHFTVSPHEVFTCGLQLAAILKHVYQRKKSWVYSELSAVFGEFCKITIVGPSSIHRLAWNTTANYMDFLPWKWS